MPTAKPTGKRLTHAAVQRFRYRPGESRIQRIWDTEVSGLGLEAFPSGRKSWIFRYRVFGKQRIMTFGSFSDFTLEQVREMGVKARAQIRNGEDPIVMRGVTGDVVTLQSLWDEYRESQYFKTRSLSFQHNMASTVALYLLPDLGHVPITAIRRVQIATRVDALIEAQKEGAARALLNRARILFNYAVERDLAKDSPADDIRPKYTTSGKRKTWLQADDELHGAWWLNAALQVRLLTRWMLLTGCRRDEARTATWDQIDGDVWRVPNTKNGLALALPITPMMQRVLDEIRPTFGATSYLFPATTTNFKPIPSSSWDYALGVAVEGKVKWSAHVLRHTVESHLAKLGIPEEQRDAVLNHVRKSTGARYQHDERLDMKRAALGLWHEKLQAIVDT